MRVLSPGECAAGLVCPRCRSATLQAGGDAVTCTACGRAYPCRRGVIDFVIPEHLDADARREHTANAIDLDRRKAVARRVRKGEGNPFLMAQTRRALRPVLRMLGPYDASCELVSVGSGSGFELRTLLEQRRFARVYSSDLAWSATALVPQVLAQRDGELGLFAADFTALPLAPRATTVGLSFLALHHAPDPHAALQALLGQFEHLVIVEPVTNGLVEVLARLGQARRVEYSGLRPEWLEVRRMRGIARQLGYDVTVETWWEIPRSRLPRRVRVSRHLWRPLFAAGEAVSAMSRPLSFGSMAAVRFAKSGAPGTPAP